MTSKNQIGPLKTLEEALNWVPVEPQPYQYPDCYHRSSFFMPGDTWRGGDRSWDSLVKSPLVKSQGDEPKTLICHDMMGGYIKDRFIDGLESDNADTGYHLDHWANIDYHCYFSHNFVTIPPIGWIAAAR